MSAYVEIIFDNTDNRIPVSFIVDNEVASLAGGFPYLKLLLTIPSIPHHQKFRSHSLTNWQAID